MLTPLPFALQATQACVPHAELALSLAAAFHDVDAGLLDDSAMPESVIGGDVCCLMLDDALAQSVAHPLVRAIVAIEVGRRHGLDLGLVSNGSEHCIGHERLGEPLLLRADSGEIVDAQTLSGTLQWHCSHEACGLLLDELEQRWLLWTRIDNALHAADLRLRLPLDDESSQAARLRLAHVRARLN